MSNEYDFIFKELKKFIDNYPINSVVEFYVEMPDSKIITLIRNNITEMLRMLMNRDKDEKEYDISTIYIDKDIDVVVLKYKYWKIITLIHIQKDIEIHFRSMKEPIKYKKLEVILEEEEDNNEVKKEDRRKISKKVESIYKNEEKKKKKKRKRK
tara:strand:+ start:6123 stop:6584 length:462 start_codon:yes stop_codon:yes gene_type:complete